MMHESEPKALICSPEKISKHRSMHFYYNSPAMTETSDTEAFDGNKLKNIVLLRFDEEHLCRLANDECEKEMAELLATDGTTPEVEILPSIFADALYSGRAIFPYTFAGEKVGASFRSLSPCLFGCLFLPVDCPALQLKV